MNRYQVLNTVRQATTYRELQKALKTAREFGLAVNCKLNAKKEVLTQAAQQLIADFEQEQNLATNSLTQSYQTEQISRRAWETHLFDLEEWAKEQLSDIKQIASTEADLLRQKTAEHQLTLAEIHSLYRAYPSYH